MLPPTAMLPPKSFFALMMLTFLSADVGEWLGHQPKSIIALILSLSFAAISLAIYVQARKREAIEAHVASLPFELSPTTVVALPAIAAVLGFLLPPGLLSLVGFVAVVVVTIAIVRKGATP